jgi:crotonobetainyl-CoA:carnitine CoA-transferase CaiB-like acyl-CoA transferase
MSPPSAASSPSKSTSPASLPPRVSGPLLGVRVLDASTVLAAPLACQVLGDFGADVIKIEHPVQGDSFRSHGPNRNGHGLWWKIVGRNKRNIGLYLGDPRGAEIFLRLVDTADVLVENFRPGTLEKWGLGPEVLHKRNPRLVIARVTGFGQTGPYASRPGFGTLAEAMSGFAALTGEPDGPPTLPPMGLADTVAGLAGVSAIMMALFHRDRPGGSGLGQVIDLSLLEPMMVAVGPGPTVFDQLGTLQKRTGNRSSANAPRNIYRTKDDKWMAISTSATSIAERVMVIVGHPEVIEEPWFSNASGRVQHADLLDEMVASWIACRTAEEVARVFEEAQAAVAPVYTAEDVLEDEHVRATEMMVTVSDPDLGPIRMNNVLFRMSATPGSINATGAALGAHTDAVLAEIGIDPAEILELQQQGVVR